MELQKTREAGLTKKEQKRIKAFRKYGNLHFFTWGLVRDYHPEKDVLIRKALVALRRITREDVFGQGFIERLASYWDAKITYHLDEIWRSIRMRNLLLSERESYVIALKKVEELIEFARGELRSQIWFPRAEKWLDSGLDLYLASLVSYLNDPLELNEARIIDFDYDHEGAFKVIKIQESEQVESEVILIKPLPKLSDNDLMGQMMRDMGLLSSCPIGRIMVSGWNLNLVELENGQFLTRTEAMLIEFGGCPLGWKYNSLDLRHDQGYCESEKSCQHCWKKQFCPGDGELRSLSLGGLAAKLRFAWDHRHDIQKVFPKFANLKLAHKQV